MNSTDKGQVGGVPFVDTGAPGPKHTTVWEFAKTNGLGSAFYDTKLIDGDYKEVASVTYHIGGGGFNLWIIIAVIVIVILVLSGAGYYFFSKQGEGAQAASENVTMIRRTSNFYNGVGFIPNDCSMIPTPT